MAKLIALTPCADLLPLVAGRITLSEHVPEAITSVSPFAGRGAEVSAALKEIAGGRLPKPNRTTGARGFRVIWTGRHQVMVLGPPVSVPGAAIADQSDGWAVLRLAGPGADQVLARLTPVDLRRDVFKPGHTARTLLRHMSCSITRTGAESYEIMVFRSMAKTAVHDICEAMTSVAARA
ncbi:MAG: sarcosine oxidase subunit gamma [Alphaproteobacteria bacterium]|nr:sarcosine oxidase subunit gamma [Alphaproteobacteria bacterium]NNF23592.1 sarcosine oxidase subunit gamma [Paracoccaceae bacterium]